MPGGSSFVCVTRQKNKKVIKRIGFWFSALLYPHPRDLHCCRVSAAFLLFVYPFLHIVNKTGQVITLGDDAFCNFCNGILR